ERGGGAELARLPVLKNPAPRLTDDERLQMLQKAIDAIAARRDLDARLQARCIAPPAFAVKRLEARRSRYGRPRRPRRRRPRRTFPVHAPPSAAATAPTAGRGGTIPRSSMNRRIVSTACSAMRSLLCCLSRGGFGRGGSKPKLLFIGWKCSGSALVM